MGMLLPTALLTEDGRSPSLLWLKPMTNLTRAEPAKAIAAASFLPLVAMAKS